MSRKPAPLFRQHGGALPRLRRHSLPERVGHRREDHLLHRGVHCQPRPLSRPGRFSAALRHAPSSPHLVPSCRPTSCTKSMVRASKECARPPIHSPTPPPTHATTRPPLHPPTPPPYHPSLCACRMLQLLLEGLIDREDGVEDFLEQVATAEYVLRILRHALLCAAHSLRLRTTARCT